MPKLNLVGMVVLCLAVAAGAAVMALRAGGPSVDAPRLDRLIRGLADTDPDLRREAEQELKVLGSKAEPALKEAARGSDPAVAERARVLLGIKGPETPSAVSKPSEALSDPAPAASRIRLTLQVASSPRRPDEPLLYFLRLHNDLKRAVTVARHAKFGGFERVDSEGRVVTLGDAASEPLESADVLTVKPGESIDLAPGAGLLRIGASGSFRVRFVYDASEGSEYRDSFSTGHQAGSILPAERFVSNEVVVRVQ